MLLLLAAQLLIASTPMRADDERPEHDSPVEFVGKILPMDEESEERVASHEVDQDRSLFGPLVPEEAFAAEGLVEEPVVVETPRARLRRSGSRRGVGGRGGPPGYKVTFYPGQKVSGQDEDMAVLRQEVTAMAPLWMKEGNRVMLSLGVQNTHFSGNAVLPDSGRPFPSELWNINVGLTYIHQYDNGWTGTLLTGLGTAGDKPFQGADEMTGLLGGMLTMPTANQRDAWVLGAIYSYGSALDFPIPVVSYVWNPSDEFQMNIGVPFRLHWEITPSWELDASYTPVTNGMVRATFHLNDLVQVYGGYESLTESYFLSDRQDSEDRFFVFEQRLITGVQWDFREHLSATLMGGYSFGREFGEGRRQGDSLHDEVSLQAGPFIGLHGAWNF